MFHKENRVFVGIKFNETQPSFEDRGMVLFIGVVELKGEDWVN